MYARPNMYAGPGTYMAPPAPVYGGGTVGLGRNDLVSGEAVALDLPPASLGRRIVSGVIDVVIAVVVLIALFWVSVKIGMSLRDGAVLAGAFALSSVLALIVLPTAVETLSRGKSLGHWALGLRTVRDDAGPIGFRHAFTRSLVGVVEIFVFFGVPAIVCAAISRKDKRVGDLVAGTYVIRDRRSLEVAGTAIMPPHLAEWARTADIGVLTDHQAMLIRGFLHQAPSIRDDALRAALARQLVQTLAPYISPAPPAGANDVDVLNAVAAQRRQREWLRLQRDEELRRRVLR